MTATRRGEHAARPGPVKVLIAAGGSGGHIFPAIALARSLAAPGKNVTVRFVGGRRGLDERIFRKEGFDYRLLSGNKLSPRNKLLLPLFLVKLLLDFIASILIIVSYRPGVIVGFGGYVSFPVIIAGRMCAVASVIHEQNVSPGRANALLFRLADRIGVSFNETKQRLGRYQKKTVLTGNPIRREMVSCDRAHGLRSCGLEDGRFTILVVGGSQGAHRLNEMFLRALALLDAATRQRLQVVHLTGTADYGWALGEYRALGITHRVYSFLDRIEEAYSAADLIITRSGASAIFEAALFGRPMVLVPYPFAMDHQLENARSFAARGAAVVLEEKELTGERFAREISDLMRRPERLAELSEAAKRSSVPDASERLASVVMAAL